MAGERQFPGLDLYGFWTDGSNGYGDQLSGNFRALSALTQASVISRTTNLPGSPSEGDIYIVPTGQTNAEDVAVYENSAWVYFTPVEGWLAYVQDDNEYASFDGTAWDSFTLSGGVSAFLNLSDTPANYTGAASQILRVNAAGNAVEFVAPGTAYPVADIVTALNGELGSTDWQSGGGSSTTEIVADATTARTLAAGDFTGTRVIRMTSSSANTVTVAPSLTVTEPVHITMAGTGTTTIAAGSGVTLTSLDSNLDISGQHGMVTIIPISSDNYLVVGALA